MFDYVYELFKPVAGRSGSGWAPFFIHTKCVLYVLPRLSISTDFHDQVVVKSSMMSHGQLLLSNAKLVVFRALVRFRYHV